ncbi:isoprenylcysteine carboxylmethyltransferase family protein [Pelagovum sp. HNIBRBA483]|uniref:methyltransferase family protein n=1 Tax=Pelagovum sp. HNIBRBA483 TaxID=3233341 RepID=UPI0034A4D825
MQNGLLIAIGRFFFYHRNWVFPVLIIGLFALVRPASAAPVRDFLAAVFLVAGLLVRFLVLAATPVSRDGIGKRVNAEELRTSGMFSACRNPLYVGNMLIAFGYFVLHGDFLIIVLGVVLTVAIYQAIIANEENYLRGRFGKDYVNYLARTNRWWPRLGALKDGFSGMEVSLTTGLRRDRSVLLSVAVITAGTLWYRASGYMPPLASWVVLGGGILLYSLVRGRDKSE